METRSTPRSRPAWLVLEAGLRQLVQQLVVRSPTKQVYCWSVLVETPQLAVELFAQGRSWLVACCQHRLSGPTCLHVSPCRLALRSDRGR